MKRRFFYLLAMPIGVGLLAGGCGTTGPSMPRYGSGKPQTLLVGAEVQQVKSIAMGSAVSKGWTIIDSSGNRLLVRRPLDTAAAESIAGGPVSTASVEVTTEFYERQNGVDVVVDAGMIAGEGESKKRIEFTDSYRNELNRSLDSLRRSWEENRWRVASATPPLPTKVAVAADQGAEGTPAALGGEPIVDSAAASSPRVSAATAWPETPPPTAEPVAVLNAGNDAAPVHDRFAAAPPPPIAAGSPAVNPAENMLALNRTVEPGVWAYYAEHYAKIRGCEVSDGGAVLEDTQPEYEIHRVSCDNGQEFRVKCNAGACRGLE